MDTSLVGQEVELNGIVYKVVGTIKKSYLLEHDGKQYKITADKIKRIQNYKSGETSVGFPHLERRLKFAQIFNKAAKLPTNEQECMGWFFQLSGELSPENLSSDGEASASQVRAKLSDIRATWRELEKIAGRKFSEDEIETLSIKQYRGTL